MNENTKANLDRIKKECNCSLEVLRLLLSNPYHDSIRLEPNSNVNSYFSQRLFYFACTM